MTGDKSAACGFVMTGDKMLPGYERYFVEWEIEKGSRKDLKPLTLFNRVTTEKSCNKYLFSES